MAEFKCISCGAVKESEKPCSCPECGYKMFPLPYDRKNTLINEIRDFVIGYEISSVENKDLTYKDKAKDDARFPDFGKIQGYVCNAKSTEMFFKHYYQSLTNLREHIRTPFQNKYEVITTTLKYRIEKYSR